MPEMAKKTNADDIEHLAEEAQRALRDGTARVGADDDTIETGAGAAVTIDELEDDEEGARDVAEEGIPAGAMIPAGFAFPPGWLVWFITFPASMTNRPKGPDRQCILWNLSEADEKRAVKMARGDGLRVIDEMAKCMIRSVDGKKIVWRPIDPRTEEAQSYGNLAQFWTEIGGKCRHQIKSLYLKTHAMDGAENARFFESCITPRTVG